MQSAEASNLAIPLASLGKMAEAFELAGAAFGGELKCDNVRFDAASGVTTGKISVDGASVRVPLPQNVRAVASDMLNFVNQKIFAIAVKSIAEAGAKDCFADLLFSASKGKFSLTGRLAPGTIIMKVPYMERRRPSRFHRRELR